MSKIGTDIDQLKTTLAAFEATILEAPRVSLPRVHQTTSPFDDHEAPAGLAGGGVQDRLSFEGILGEGGMGTVHLAEQRSLGRQVAVKTLRATTTDAIAASALLSEGWVMGTLEHPNIPPVHDAMLDDQGSPILLLKRIEGEEWASLMGNEELVQTRFGESALLWNLGVLDKVCDALGYAHSKRIVHRDLKPENVMIGAFGEVYVLDWGIAATLDNDAKGKLPYIGDTTQPSGTPCFMAPEQLEPSPARVDNRTDVYLIGAVLYEVLVGKPPHQGTNFTEIIESIHKSQPKFPEDVPTSLANICRTAMKANPAERYQSVEQLQQALRHYERRRASQQLVEEASERLSRASALAVSPPTEETDAEISALLLESRFALQQALESFPDDEIAIETLDHATRMLASRAIDAGQVDAASSLMRKLATPDPELASKLDVLLVKQSDDRRRLETLDRHQNSELDNTGRIAVVVLFTILMTGGSLSGELIKYAWPSRLTALTVGWQIFLVVSFVVGFRRGVREQTENNRLTFVIITAALSGQLIATVGAWLAGFPIETIMLIDSALWVTAALTGVLVWGVIYAPSLVGYTICMLIIALKPDMTFYGITFGNVVMALNAGLIYILTIRPKALISSPG
jgi:serine/threonine-protein kinase